MRSEKTITDPMGGLYKTHDYDPQTRTFVPKPYTRLRALLREIYWQGRRQRRKDALARKEGRR